MSAEEAAEALGIKVPALKSRLLRARLLLRESLGHHFEERRQLSTRRILDSAKRPRNMMKVMAGTAGQ